MYDWRFPPFTAMAHMAQTSLAALHSVIQPQAPNCLSFYCVAHRAPRVDFDVTSLPKADMNDANALLVREMARRLDALLSKTAKFFSVSTKRWASLRKVAVDLGYHIQHGPVRKSADQGN